MAVNGDEPLELESNAQVKAKADHVTTAPTVTAVAVWAKADTILLSRFRGRRSERQGVLTTAGGSSMALGDCRSAAGAESGTATARRGMASIATSLSFTGWSSLSPSSESSRFRFNVGRAAY